MYWKCNFSGTKCVQNCLLRRQGNIKGADVTPYLFKSQYHQDNEFKYTTKRKKYQRWKFINVYTLVKYH